MRWLFSTDARDIGVLYLLLSFFSGIIGTFLSMAIRLQLMDINQKEILSLPDTVYNNIITVHAILMIFFLVMPAMFGGFGNIFLPSLIGAVDMAFPRLNNVSFWLLFSALILGASSMIIGVGLGTGWTVGESSSKISLDAKTSKNKKRKKFRGSELYAKDIQFYQWLVGFTDGNGYFIICKNNNNYELKFSISQSIYNIKILYYIKKNLGYGNISKENKMVQFNISDRKILKKRIFPIFDKYNLLTSKYYNYNKLKKVWEILEDKNLNKIEKRDKIDLLLLEKLPENYISPKLRNLNENSNYFSIKSIISIYWLIGFIEGKGNFVIFCNKLYFSLSQRLDYLLLYLIKRLLHIPGKLYIDNKNMNNLKTSNSRVIKSIINLFKNKFKGIKSLEFKLWSKGKYYYENKNYKKIEKISLILTKLRDKSH